MKIERPKIKIDGQEFEILSMDEFKQRIGSDVPTPTIAFNFENDRLDYTTIGHARYIIYNEKAKKFEAKFKSKYVKKINASAMSFSI